MPGLERRFPVSPTNAKLTKQELVRAIRFMVAAEYEAVQMYMRLAESTNNSFTVAVLKDIADEERGPCRRILEAPAPPCPEEAKLYKKGAKEVDGIRVKYKRSNWNN